MAAKYPKEAESPNNINVSISELEKSLQQLSKEVAEEKLKLNATFQHLHQMLVEKEETLMAELDAIPADISAKIAVRRESLEQLSKLEEETKNVYSNELNDFLEQQLSGIQDQIEKIFSEQILFPRVSLSCHTKNIQKSLEDNCHITKTPNPYIIRTRPLWNEGKGSDLISYFSDAICIDKNSQLIYVADTYRRSCKIQVFNFEGEYAYSTLLNKEVMHINSMQAYGDYIYVSSKGYIHKLNKKGDIVKILPNPLLNISLFIEDMKLYFCSFKSSIVAVYDLNLKYIRSITLWPISFDGNTVTHDIIVKKQHILVLFRSNLRTRMYNHPDPIQIFQLDGTFIRSLVTGSSIKKAMNFCVDSYENILVSDIEGNCIRIFSPEGILIQSIGEDGELECPRGISIDSRGRIIILNGKGVAKLQAF